jgi:hypothetical protein
MNKLNNTYQIILSTFEISLCFFPAEHVMEPVIIWVKQINVEQSQNQFVAYKEKMLIKHKPDHTLPDPINSI